MEEQRSLETIWEIPDDLWEKIQAVLFAADPPKSTGAGVPINGKCSTGLSFECVAAANGTICPRNWVVTAPSTALSSVG